MTVGIVGLGLIGGSFAKAYQKEGHRVLGQDLDRSVLDFAVMSGAVSAELREQDLKTCDLILICVTPRAAVKWLRAAAPAVGGHGVVIDCCGTKQAVCSACFELSRQYGFCYVGGHPMAGTHHSGFKYAAAALFEGAPMVIVPPDFNNIELLERVKALLAPAHFGSVSVTTAEQHDEMIAFTSQLAHLVSNAYIKSPTARLHQGFSAGSYKDMTRVAWLNAPMWAELFLENRDYLLEELSRLTEHLTQYKTAMEQNDFAALSRLLEDGKRCKEEVDGH